MPLPGRACCAARCRHKGCHACDMLFGQRHAIKAPSQFASLTSNTLPDALVYDWTHCFNCSPPQRYHGQHDCLPLVSVVSDIHDNCHRSSPYWAACTGHALLDVPSSSPLRHSPAATPPSRWVPQMRDFVRRRVWKRSRITWALAQELAASGTPSAVPLGGPLVVAPEEPSATPRAPPEALPMNLPGEPSGISHIPEAAGPSHPVGSSQAAAPMAAEAAGGQVRHSRGCLVNLPAIWIVCGADSLRPAPCRQQVDAQTGFRHQVPEQ